MMYNFHFIAQEKAEGLKRQDLGGMVEYNRTHGESCGPFGHCADGLTCAFPSFECFHSPRQLHEPCGPTNWCAEGLSCEGFPSSRFLCYHEPRRHYEPCSKKHPCAEGLACVGEFPNFNCYHSPPQRNDPCGPENPCAEGLTCGIRCY